VGATWFRCYPSKLLGTLGGLEPDCGYLYTIILLRICEDGGPIPDDVGALARRSGISIKKVSVATERLIKLCKVERVEGGLLHLGPRHDSQIMMGQTDGVRLSTSEWLKLRAMIFERDGFQCSYCDSRDRLECDHIIAVSRGGSNHPSNLATACSTCNRSKGAKSVEEWRDA
jgi:HNH endonuclease